MPPPPPRYTSTSCGRRSSPRSSGSAAVARKTSLSNLADAAPARAVDVPFDFHRPELRTFLNVNASAPAEIHEYFLRAPLLAEEFGIGGRGAEDEPVEPRRRSTREGRRRPLRLSPAGAPHVPQRECLRPRRDTRVLPAGAAPRRGVRDRRPWRGRRACRTSPTQHPRGPSTSPSTFTGRSSARSST